MERERQTDMTKLTIVFLNFANAPNKYKVLKVNDKFKGPSVGEDYIQIRLVY
jgi:hypothetical protein